jgi:hypothetical protein
MARPDTVDKADILFKLSNESHAIWNIPGCMPAVTVRCTIQNFPYTESVTDTIRGLLRKKGMCILSKSQDNLVLLFIIQADDMFRPLFSGNLQVTRYITFEEAILTM